MAEADWQKDMRLRKSHSFITSKSDADPMSDEEAKKA